MTVNRVHSLPVPAVVGMAMTGSAMLFFLLSYVVPKITKIFTENQGTLPLVLNMR
jgi:type II secretory pathway component PulF